MNLMRVLDEQGIGEGLPTIERLQLLSDETPKKHTSHKRSDKEIEGGIRKTRTTAAG